MNDSYSITYDTNGGSISSKSSTSNYKIIDNGEYLIRSTIGSKVDIYMLDGMVIIILDQHYVYITGGGK